MAISQREEARALSTDERDLVEKSHHPLVQGLSDRELADLTRLVRERREKAKAQAHQRRREIRGKVEAKGASASKADHGSKLKLEVLAMAVRRLNGETERRRTMAASVTLIANAWRALAMKQAADHIGPAHNSRTAHEGMRNAANQRAQNLMRPMERGRLRKAAAVAQAKKDARQGSSA